MTPGSLLCSRPPAPSEDQAHGQESRGTQLRAAQHPARVLRRRGRAPDRTRPLGAAEIEAILGTRWQEHKRDTSVIPDLSASDLTHFRLLADIRADIPVVNAATQELWRRGIRDYLIAI